MPVIFGEIWAEAVKKFSARSEPTGTEGSGCGLLVRFSSKYRICFSIKLCRHVGVEAFTWRTSIKKLPSPLLSHASVEFTTAWGSCRIDHGFLTAIEEISSVLRTGDISTISSIVLVWKIRTFWLLYGFLSKLMRGLKPISRSVQDKIAQMPCLSFHSTTNR